MQTLDANLTVNPTASVFSATPLQLDRMTSWEVYRRLQELEIPCQYGLDRPLTVEADTPLAIAQVWSVVKTITTPRVDLVASLNRCWQQRMCP